jgi:DNA-binding NarL/FixJ family response regulator
MTTRILLVDDHPGYLERARALLEQHPDIEVGGIALSGEEAILLAANIRPDLVLVDFQMPGLNGIETTRALKAQDPDIPVIIVTAHDDEEYRIAAREAGANDWVSKTEIADVLDRIIEEHSRWRN